MTTDSTNGKSINSNLSNDIDDFDGEAWCLADLDTFEEFCAGKITLAEIDEFRENAYQQYKSENGDDE